MRHAAPLDLKPKVHQTACVKWTPPGAEDGYDKVLFEGVPPWLTEPMHRWLLSLYPWPLDLDALEMFDLMTRRPDSLASTVQHFSLKHALNYMEDEELLLLIDFALAKGTNAGDALEKVLSIGSSEWRVGRRGDNAGLEKRVADGVRSTVEVASSVDGHAGDLLGEAWRATFGLNPDYEKAYSKAVKAVEAAAIPVVSPSNATATLGTVIADMRNQKDWDLVMTRSAKAPTSDSAVVTMAKQLWAGQNDRHAGQPDYTPSTQADAEAALFLAAPLVHWFSTQAVARRSSSQ